MYYTAAAIVIGERVDWLCACSVYGIVVVVVLCISASEIRPGDDLDG